MIKYILYGSKLLVFFASKTFYLSYLPPETLKIEKPLFFRDVKTDNFFVYFLLNDGTLFSLNPQTGSLKSKFKLKSLIYSNLFDVSSTGNFYFLLNKGGIYSILRLKFSPFDTTESFYDFNQKIINFYVIKDSFFIFVFKDKTKIFRKKSEILEIKGESKNCGKFKNIFFDYKNDTLYIFNGKLKKKFLSGFKSVFMNDKGIFVIKNQDIEFIKND